jgi:hypothetical protein
MSDIKSCKTIGWVGRWVNIKVVLKIVYSNQLGAGRKKSYKKKDFHKNCILS